MRHTLIASVRRIRFAAITALTTIGFASVASAKSPPPPVVTAYSWTGFYIGGNIGYSWGSGSASFYQPSSPVDGMAFALSGSQRLVGVVGGPEIGYNWQATDTWLLGLEADFQWSGEKGSSSFNYPFVASAQPSSLSGSLNSNIRWFGTVRGRIGALVNPAMLLYLTGGLAYGEISTSGSVADTFALGFPTCACGFFAFGDSTTKVGWTIGAGVEGAVPNTRDWVWKIEYLYIDFGSINGNGAQIGFLGAAFPFSWSTRVTNNILRVGLDYRFH